MASISIWRSSAGLAKWDKTSRWAACTDIGSEFGGSMGSKATVMGGSRALSPTAGILDDPERG